MNLRFLLVLSLVTLALVGCDTADETTPTPLLEVRTQRNLDARGDSTVIGMMGPVVVQARPSTFFNLRTGHIRTVADSNSTNWDLAFEGTRIMVNGGISGPGNGAAVVVNDLFENVVTAPADGQFRVDAAGGATNLAIVAQGNTMPPNPLGWYTTGQIVGAPAQATLITPTPGRTIVVRCADGKFAKVQIQSYYLNAPDPATVTVMTQARFYTFRWVVQPDGSRNLR